MEAIRGDRSIPTGGSTHFPLKETKKSKRSWSR
jgi:hypothetical protein